MATADGEQAIDAADADIQWLTDWVTVERVDRRAVHRHPILGFHAALAIKRTAGAIEHAPEHRHAHRQAPGIRQRHHTRTGRNPGQAADRHQIDLATGKAHHLGFDLHRVIAVTVDHQAAAADGGT